MKAIRLDKNLYAAYDLNTRFIQIVEYDALRARLRSLQETLEARREELEALKQSVSDTRIPASVEEMIQGVATLDRLHTIARDSDALLKTTQRIDEIVPEYKLAKEMWSAIEASQDGEALRGSTTPG